MDVEGRIGWKVGLDHDEKSLRTRACPLSEVSPWVHIPPLIRALQNRTYKVFALDARACVRLCGRFSIHPTLLME